MVRLRGLIFMEKKIRLQKAMSRCSIASRRACEILIKEGKVAINGALAKIGDKVDLKTDKITLCGKSCKIVKNKKYIAIYKPRGYVTTMRDEYNRKSVADLVKNIETRIYPVGRLDKDSEGLLIMTNDGDFANFLLHPSNHVEKVYEIEVKPRILNFQIKKLKDPAKLLSCSLLPVKVFLVKNYLNKSILRLTLREGKNRQIRKMCEALGIRIEKLKRISIGKLKLNRLIPGKYREFSLKDVV
jgi:23S rRNA pseudouridine2605 synthase